MSVTDPVSPFSEIYEQTFPLVLRALRRHRVSESSLDDAVQEVYLVAYRRLGDFEGRSSLSTWLYGIARRVAAQHHRRRNPTPPSEDSLCELADVSALGPFEEVARKEAAEMLEQALGEVPAERREVLVLAELENLTGPEIAESLGLRLDTVYWRLRKGRDELAQALHRRAAHESWRHGRAQSIDERRRRCWSALALTLGLGPSTSGHATTLGGAAKASGHATTLGGAAKAGAVTLMVTGAFVLGSLRDDGIKARPAAAPETARAAPSLPRSPEAPEPRKTRKPRKSEDTENEEGTGRPADGSPPPEVEEAIAPLPPRRRLRSRRPAAPERSSEAKDTLAREAAMLLEADRALRGGDFARARAKIERHRRRFPDGVLQREREALDAVASCLKRRDTAPRARGHVGEPSLDVAVAKTVRRACGVDPASSLLTPDPGERRH